MSTQGPIAFMIGSTVVATVQERRVPFVLDVLAAVEHDQNGSGSHW